MQAAAARQKRMLEVLQSAEQIPSQLSACANNASALRSFMPLYGVSDKLLLAWCPYLLDSS